MKKWLSVFFWLSVLGGVVWGFSAFTNGVVIGHYHPMAAAGDLFFHLRMWSGIVPVFAALTIAMTWIFSRPLSDQVYAVALCAVGLGALLPFLPRFDSGYEQVYWIGDQRYEIPWGYGPYNGQETPGGTFFVVRVSSDDLKPVYKANGERIILGRASVSNAFGRRLPATEETCASDTRHFECHWTRGAAFYKASGPSDAAPSDLEHFMDEATDLLESFASDPG